jgi:hypothetical protein
MSCEGCGYNSNLLFSSIKEERRCRYERDKGQSKRRMEIQNQ